MKGRFLLACFLVTVLAHAPSATAITFDLNTPFGPGGAGSPVQPPLLTATFDNDPGKGVQLKLSASGLPSNFYVAEWYFNIFNNTEIAPPAQLGLPADPRLQNFNLSPDLLPAGPAGSALGLGFDFSMIFSEKGDLFGAQKTATFLFSLPAGIIADWFNELNLAGAFYAAARILTSGGAGESWIASGPVTPPKPEPKPVPEPGTTLLFGCGLIGLAFIGGRKLRKLRK